MMTETQAVPVHGTICWNEVMTRDVDAARSFYAQLLGWTTEEMPMGDMGTYTMFRKGDTQVAGMMGMDGPQFEGVPSHWLSYIAVESVEDRTAAARNLGATVHVPPTDIPNIGRFSVIADPTGAVIALFEKSS
jgi:predicted enzyme related to lactoylglutathione lyase